MKIEYFHASEFGNGATVADEFKKQMVAEGVAVNVHHIREASPKELPPADLYLFSSPGRMGKPIGGMRRFLKKEEVEAMEESRGGDALQSARALLDAAKANYVPQVVIGPVAETIARIALEQNCDGIVMGTRGLGAAASVLLGSVASKVIHLADVPVTLVK